MLITLYCDDERARINDDGHVNYHEDTSGKMILTDAPSETMVAMVAAVLPFATSDLNDAFARVQRLKLQVRDAAVALENAEKMESEARARESELVAQLWCAEQSLQEEQSC